MYGLVVVSPEGFIECFESTTGNCTLFFQAGHHFAMLPACATSKTTSAVSIYHADLRDNCANTY